MYVCLCACACACVCVFACVRVCVCVCVRVRGGNSENVNEPVKETFIVAKTRFPVALVLD